MKVLVTDSAKLQLRKLQRPNQARILKKLLRVEEIGPSILAKLTDTKLFRLRVGDYRVIGAIRDDSFTVLYIGHRSNVYKELQ